VSKERFEAGLQRRKETLGAEYVERVMDNATDFTRPFQEMMTEWCWGFGWTDETLPPKTRSMLNLVMLAALNRMEEWELHLRGSVNTGVTRDEVQALIHHAAIYCGVPVGVECFRRAKKVFAELDAS